MEQGFKKILQHSKN